MVRVSNSLFFAITTAILIGCAPSTQFVRPLPDKRLALIPPSEMQKLGSAALSEVLAKYQGGSESDVVALAKCVATNLSRAVTTAPQEWRLHLINSDLVSIESFPPNHLVVHSGFIRKFPGENALAAGLSNAIAHIVNQSANQRISREVVEGTNVGSRGSPPITEEFESQLNKFADMVALRILARSGYPPEELAEIVDGQARKVVLRSVAKELPKVPRVGASCGPEIGA